MSVFSIIAFALISFGIYFIATANDSSSWIKTPAKVISYSIVNVIEQRNAGSKKGQYAIKIQYQYTFKNTTFIKNRISFGKGLILKGKFEDRNAALKWLNGSEFAKNKMIEVYVDPNNPNEAVIYNGIAFITFVPLIIGLFFVILVIYGIKSGGL